MLKEILKEFDLEPSKIEKLNLLREIVLEYNEHTNLTSITDEKDFNVKHILDSLSILKYVNLDNKKILDVGSGGGFPGLALAIVLSDSEITMLDSNNKKTKFIDYAIQELKLENAKTINSRVEDANILEGYDAIVSRAVSSLNILLELTAFAAKLNGDLIFYKGSNVKDELPNKWESVENKLGIRFINDYSYKLDEETVRRIILFNKKSKTNSKFPRNYSQIKNNPIY